jgi:hypothetical protein
VLLAHCRPAPAIASWNLSFVEFDGVLKYMSDSAPGPDGIPYSAWAKSSKSVRSWLHEAYTRWIEGAVLPEGFNHSFMVFLAKGEEDGDAVGISRTPACTRPLTLSNTRAKIFAAALNRRLADIVAVTVHPQQRGFCKGRSIADDIIEIDSHAVWCTQNFSDKSGTTLLDLLAAFPSVAHAWIFIVLTHMGFPATIIFAIQQLYFDCRATVKFGDAHYSTSS